MLCPGDIARFKGGNMSTIWYSHSDCLEHVTPPGHPEQVARLEYIERALSGLPLERREAPLGSLADVMLCHPETYFDKLQSAIPTDGFRSIDADTHASPGSFQAALRAVGANIAAVDAVMSGEASNAFVGCRPPGHHAETETAMGFCFFGNVAIAARHALERHGLKRVAIVDFDVHHGNGTQDLLWDEARCLFISSHQVPLYPGSGMAHERGAHGQIMNQPLDPGSDGRVMRGIYEREVFPAIDSFEPEMIFISAGFDAHRDDPLANLNWFEDDFAWLTREICALADKHCAGRVVSTLEGGYDLRALGSSAAAHVKELLEAGK